jgi:hypothetical protein
MKRLLLLVPLICIAASCPKRREFSSEVPPGFLLTEPEEVSVLAVGESGLDPNHFENVRKLIEAGLRNPFIDIVLGETNSLQECSSARLASLKIPIIRQTSFVEFSSRQFMAIRAGGEFGYAGLLAKAGASYQNLKEIHLKPNDPQFLLSYVVDPFELFALQRDAESNALRYVLFQRYIAAPSTVKIHEILAHNAGANIPVIFQGEEMTARELGYKHDRRLVLRIYSAKDKLKELVQSQKPMFVVTVDREALSYGKQDVSPRFLRFNYETNKYKLSNEYAEHLDREGVTFKVPADPDIKKRIAERPKAAKKLASPLPLKKRRR